MNSRDAILARLRGTQPPIYPPTLEKRRHVVPLTDTSPATLKTRFIDAAEKLACKVTQHSTPSTASEHILSIIGAEKTVTAWDFSLIPLPGLPEALQEAGIMVEKPDNPAVRVGITGVDAALAATGSLVLGSGTGKPRTVSLLPHVHIAVVTTAQLIPDLETWMAAQRDAGLDQFRQKSSVVLVSGASRTADIAMELVMGAHGPAELHILLLD